MIRRRLLGSFALVAFGCSGAAEGPTPIPPTGVAGVVPVSVPGVVPVSVPGVVPGNPVTVGAPQTPAAVPGVVETPGSGGPALGQPVTPGVAGPVCAPEPMPRGVRALNGAQYRNTIASVLGVENVTNPFSLSDRASRFSTLTALFRLDLGTSETVRSNSRAIAAVVAEQAMSDERCLADAEDACVDNWVRGLGRQLYRAPVNDTHAANLVNLFSSAAELSTPLEGATLVVRAMVSSPRFLFRKELGQLDAATGQYVLTPHEVASALAYTLTDAPPDAQLSADADAGMAPTELINKHTARLVADGAEGRRGLRSFLEEFFAVRDYPTAEKDAELFPEFDGDLRRGLMEDFGDTIDGIMGSANPTLSELIAGKEFSVGEGTAELLGWNASEGLSPVQEVERQGLMTHPVVLGTYARETETNPVARGHFVSGNLLCVTIPDPPEDVVFPEIEQDDGTRTLRQVLDEQHSVAACAGCHSLMDPLGYPFEKFDAVGRLRDNDRGLPLDTTGAIVATNEIDGPVSGLGEMLTKVAGSDAAHTCFAGQAFRYVTGLGAVSDIKCRTEGISTDFIQSRSVPELFREILSSPQFLTRSNAPLAE